MNMKRGMTLIEVVVAISMIAVVMVAASDSALSLYRANVVGVGSVNQISQGRRATQLITTDIRQTNIGNNGADAIAAMSPYGITFYSNISNGYGSQKITYAINGTTLTRSVVQPGTPATYSGTPSLSTASEFVKNVTSGVPLFRFYDGGGNEITDMNQTSSVRVIQATLRTQGSSSNTPFTFTSRITLRNVRTP